MRDCNERRDNRSCKGWGGVVTGQELGAQEVEEGSMEGMVAIERRGWHRGEGGN